MGRKRTINYVDNDRLRELVVLYNDLNPNDNGQFLDKYESTMKKKGKYESVRSWIALRREKYSKPRKHTPEFEKVSNELFCAIKRIVEGRVSCFSIPFDEKEDLIQECLLTVLTYINRYREDMESSAFAYITQLINNSVALYMGQDVDSRWCRVPWNEVNDQCMALMYGSEDNNEEE